MEIKLHFLPEVPQDSCEVVVFFAMEGKLYHVINIHYSAKYKRFGCHDYMTEDAVAARKESNDKYMENMLCWAYFDEMDSEVWNEA